MSATAILGTMALQFGAAWINSCRNNKKSDELATKQRAYDEKVAKEGIERARQEYAELCALQRELESSMHADRQDRLKECHEDILKNIAYAKALQKWPLLVPPYVITNQTLSELDNNAQTPVPPTCILTTSRDGKFNEAIFPLLEERLARFCMRHWNGSMSKSIRFMQQAWRDTTIDAGARVKNLHAHLKAIPTLILSPKVNNIGLSYLFQWWGISTAPCDCMINEETLPIKLSVELYENKIYQEQEIQTIVEEAGSQLEAFISYFADLYYWNFYHLPFSLPQQYDKWGVHLKKVYLETYEKVYFDQIITSIINKKHNNINAELLIQELERLRNLTLSDASRKELTHAIIKGRDYLTILDFPLLDYASKLIENDDKLIQELAQIKKHLHQNEIIDVTPCSNIDEFYYHLCKIKKHVSTKNAICYARKHRNNVWYVCFSTNGKILLLNHSSRCHLFVFTDDSQLGTSESLIIEYPAPSETKNTPTTFISPCFCHAVSHSINPCFQIDIPSEIIEKQTSKAQSFLEQVNLTDSTASFLRRYDEIYKPDGCLCLTSFQVKSLSPFFTRFLRQEKIDRTIKSQLKACRRKASFLNWFLPNTVNKRNDTDGYLYGISKFMERIPYYTYSSTITIPLSTIKDQIYDIIKNRSAPTLTELQQAMMGEFILGILYNKKLKRYIYWGIPQNDLVGLAIETHDFYLGCSLFLDSSIPAMMEYRRVHSFETNNITYGEPIKLSELE